MSGTSGVPEDAVALRTQVASLRAANESLRALLEDKDAELAEAGLPFVMALKPRRGTWAYGADAPTPADTARELRWGGLDDPGDWHPVTRAFRDGYAETWLVVATADPGTLSAKATWYLVPGHEPAPPRGARRGSQPASSSRPGQDRADLRLSRQPPSHL